MTALFFVIMTKTLTLLEFATDEVLTALLVKERAKCRRRNRCDSKEHHLDRRCEINGMSTRKMLSRMMPPRDLWVRPAKKKRKRLKNGATDTSKNAQKALALTIRRDRQRQMSGERVVYLEELDAFMGRVRERLSAGQLTLEPPLLMPILKGQEVMPEGGMKVTCRPLSVYQRLEDKVILALTSRYLTQLLDKHLHENILSYRRARRFDGKEHHVTDFNDGIRLVQHYMEAHRGQDIYVADCDIKKFYDVIPHDMVRGCFVRILNKTRLSEEGKAQVMNVMEAYLRSYNFYTNAWQEAATNQEVFYKIRRKLHDQDNKNRYELGWVDEILQLPEEERRLRGVPQGGALSLVVANVVLNDVDQEFLGNADDDRLFVRYCDDIILMHTNRDECARLIECYTESLKRHGLYFHAFKSVSESKCADAPAKTLPGFWHDKSHWVYRWGEGEGDCNRYVGFLGYEMRRDGRMRLRRSNILRFKDKLNRLFHAIYRYQRDEKHSEEEKAQHRKRSLDNLLAGIDFYEAFDLQQFKRGRQYEYMVRLRARTEARLCAKA